MGEPAKAASCLLALLVCAASWSTASAFVDPNTLQQFFIIRRIDPLECTPSYNEYYRGSTHLTPLSTWNCENKLTLGQPFLPFGSYTCFLGDRSGSRGIERLRQCMEAFPAYFAFPAFSIPGVDPVGVPTADWYNIWIDKGARSRLYGSVWTAQKNWRYSSIGDYWIGTNDGQTGWYTKPPANSTYLIHSDCLTPCKTAMPGYAPTGVWSNKNNFATDDDVSVYYVGHNVFNFTDFRFFYGTSKAQGDFTYPKDQMCLKQECVKNEQLQGMYQGPVTYDWSAIAPRLTTIIGGHDAINNPSGAGITRTMTLQATQADTATLQLTNSFGFSTGMEYSESLKFGLDAAIAKGEATLNFKTSFSFTTSSAMQSTSTTTNTQQLTNTFTIVVPAWNSVECNYLLQQADNIDIPFQQTFYYKAVSYAGSEPTPLTSKQAIGALLTSTGFDGEVLDYFPTNKSVKDGMLREVQLQLDEAPVPDSLVFYSASTFKRL